MTNDDATPAFVAIPHMHPEAAPEALQSLPLPVRFFDPGLAPREQSAKFYRPESLPFDRQAARGALRSMQEFGESFGKPGQLAAYAAKGLEEYYAGSAQQPAVEMAELAQFVRSHGNMPDAGTAADNPAIHARAMAQSCQLTLLLAWAAEERYLEIAEASGKVDALQQRLDAALDRGDDEDDDEAGSLPLSVAGIPGVLEVDTLGWELAAEKMAFFLPATAAFFAWDPRIAGELDERGLEARPIADAPAPGLVEYAAPCWQLTGRSRLPEDMGWLGEVRRLVLWAV
ncbi:hypothetical protein [Oceanidesulfovibrio indonesiensis]|uniref:hypothetical protein n=1 Tax=Oceanidesulfovibrio indonesiensis TaxID=54767 RepID=UPI001431D286|nr:hypothetical protein [Oceanidesulfovibrio indonesiensis]